MSRSWRVEEIEPFFLDLLRGCPACAEPGDNPAARARLFSAPMSRGGDGDEFNEDWERYVEPEIKELFRIGTREIVSEDLAKLPARACAFPVGRLSSRRRFAPSFAHALEIPRRHAEAWLSVLNQARLIIAARRGFGEREMDEGEMPLPSVHGAGHGPVPRALLRRSSSRSSCGSWGTNDQR